jgi:hypothetical protein
MDPAHLPAQRYPTMDESDDPERLLPGAPEGSEILFRKSYYISVTALAHMLERHYYTIPRHPAASKFTVPLIELLSYLRDASTEPASPIPGTLHFKRTLMLDKTIGIDLDHVPTCLLTILTDAGGRIVTAFPGSYKSIPNL